MAKHYRAKEDVSIPRVISTSGEGDNYREELSGENYPAGSFIHGDSLPRHIKERIESGDLGHLVEEVSDEEAEQYEGVRGAEPEFGIFIAEHEAEAHALEQYGHHVIPREQELEALSSGAEHAAEYQRAAREAGLDRRHAQEAMAQPRERVPDHLLYGAETRTGSPHNRGPDEQEGDEEQGGEGEGTHAARPRPGAGSGQSIEEARAEEEAEQHQGAGQE